MRAVLACSVLAAAILSAGAQESERGALTVGGGSRVGLGRADLPPAQHDTFMGGGTWGCKVDLGWAKVDWDLGPASGSESVFAPQVSLFYKATDGLDLNISALFITAEDEDGQLGTTEADMTRLALGARLA